MISKDKHCQSNHILFIVNLFLLVNRLHSVCRCRVIVYSSTHLCQSALKCIIDTHHDKQLTHVNRVQRGLGPSSQSIM